MSTSSDIDNIPLSRVYASLQKSLSPSPSTKHQKKPDDDDTYVPMYSSVLERIGEMSQMRLDVCARLPADHPKPTTQTSEQSVLDEQVNHYQGELPGFEPSLERASEIASDEVTLESPQQ